MFWLLLSCSNAPEPEAVTPEPALRRLTVRQYHNTITDIVDGEIVLPTRLEPDFHYEGLASLGAALSATSPLGVERYEEAARSLAEQMIGDCNDAGCAEDLLDIYGRQLYRRSLTDEERSRVRDVSSQVAGASDARTGATTALSVLLQSPWFLYRIEHTPGTLDGPEFASRLSYFLWNGPPDKALLDAAEAGDLDDEKLLEDQVDRMIEDPKYRRGVRDFFTEVFDLDALDTLNKDPTVYSYASPELWASAKIETLAVLEDHVIDRDADYRQLLLRRETWIDRRLAALYDVPAPTTDGFAWVTLPEDGPRMGLLGHASLLALYAHPISSSATRRGAFMRRRLLCHYIPAPPADVDTSIPEPVNAPTRRERLVVHQEDPSCSGCHIPLDNVGLSLENFDGEGRFRTHENGGEIDPSGELDGETFDDALGLASSLANHPDLPGCMAERVYAYGTGHVPVSGEDEFIEWLAEDFERTGHSVKSMMRTLALSKTFRQVGAP